jgi:hypothetical protein
MNHLRSSFAPFWSPNFEDQAGEKKKSAPDLERPVSKISFEEVVSNEDPTKLYVDLEQIGAG